MKSFVGLGFTVLCAVTAVVADGRAGLVDEVVYMDEATSLAGLNSLELKPGAKVLFKRGVVWRGTVMARSGVTYAAYGCGGTPRVYGSPEDGADPAKWRRTDNPRVWAYSIGHRDVGTLVFDDGKQHAIKIIYRTDPKTGRRTNMTTGRPFNSYCDLDTDLHFWHDYYEDGTGDVYLYSERNPGERFKSIEFNVKCCGFRVDSSSNVTIDGIDIRYCGVHGVAAGTCTNLTVRNCVFSWIGGSIQAEGIFGRDYPTRLGNGVEVYGGCENYVVSNCCFSQIYDAGVTHQFNIPLNAVGQRFDQRHVRYLNNVFEKCNYSVEYFLTAPEGNESLMENVLIEGNIMRDAGCGFCEQRNDRGIAAHLKARYRADRNRAKNFIVRNNIFERSRDMLVHACAGLKNTDGSSSLPLFENNTFRGRRGDYFGAISDVGDDLVVYDEETEDYVNAHGAGNRCVVEPGEDNPVDQTAELQARIDKLAERGGTLVLEPGLYRSGALFFRPGVNLRLERGAILRGIDDAAGYPLRETRIEGETCVYYPALINADGCDGFTVSGEGVIDGHGLPTWKEFWALRKRKPDCTNKELMRPRLFYVSNSKNIEVSGVTFKNAKFWTTHYYRCSNLNIHDCHIVSETIGGVKGPSTDAIDLDNCRDVTIRRVRMDVNDDGVAVKGGKGPWADDPVKCPGNGPTVNVLIEDCDFGSGCHSCLTFGSECPAATNVTMRNCRVERAGNVLNLKMRADTPQHYHGIRVSNVTGLCHTVLNVRAWNQFFDLKGRKDPPKSYASDIRFADCDFICSHERNIMLAPSFEVSNVAFENVKTSGVLAWPKDADTPEKRRAAIKMAWRPNGDPFVQKEDGLRCTPLTDGKRAMRFLENGTDRVVTEIFEGYVSVLDPETGRIEASDEIRVNPGKGVYVIGENIWRNKGK